MHPSTRSSSPFACHMPISGLALRPLCLALALLAHAGSIQAAAPIEFDPRFLRGSEGQDIDLSRFRQGNILQPGTQRYDLFINGEWLGPENIRAIAPPDGGNANLCFSPAQVRLWNLNLAALPDPAEARRQLAASDTACFDAAGLIPDFQAVPAVSELTLNISIPQAYVSRHARGYVAPDKWEQGINAGFLNYNLNAYRSEYRHFDAQNNFFGNFNAGLNLGAWRLRYNASYSHDSFAGSHYQNVSTYVQRDIAPWRSQLTVGQSYTQNTLFNSVPYTGIQINSDDRMLPDSLTGFAPLIQGVADSNARVSVFQDGNQIYETSVPPGPFVIDDLYNTGYAGDLDVVVTEASGQTKRFTVPYASVAQLLRPGLSRYSLTAGRYRDRNLDSLPGFVQGTYQRGLTNLVSAYGGAIVAEHYLAGQFGLAFNTRLGAFALDATHSHASNLPASWLNAGGSMSGQSYRISFSKLVNSTNTNLTLAAYRFSSSGYLSLADFARARNPGGTRNAYTLEGGAGSFGSDNSYYGSSPYPQRHRFQATINQPLGDYGTLYVSGSTQDYWNSSQKSNTTYQAGYNKGFGWGSMNINVSRFNSGLSASETQAMLSLNIPLGRNNAPTLSTSVTRSSHGNSSVMANLHGSAGERRQLSYSIYNTYQDYEGGHDNNAGGSVQYDGRYTQVGASASAGSQGTRQGSLSLNGSVVAHGGGVNFVRNQGDTFAILHAPGATGASINGDNGSLIDGSGYGVASNLIPYRNNSVSIDPKGSSLDVEILGSSQNVAPTAGAIVMLEYETRSGRAVLMDARLDNGQAPPMGADVRNADGLSIAQVGQGGRIFVRGLEEATDLQVIWGNDAASQCRIQYAPPTQHDGNLPFARQRVQCQPLPGPQGAASLS